MKSKRFLMLVCVLSLALILTLAQFLGACAPEGDGTGTDEPLKIGTIGSRTGWLAEWATDGQDFNLAYGDYVNAHGGINGREIEVIQYDDESEEQNDFLYVKKMIEEDGCLAITGPTLTGPSMASIEAAAYEGCPFIYKPPMEQPPEVYEPGSNIFGCEAPGTRYFASTIQYLKDEVGIETIALLSTSDDSGEEDLEWVLDAIEMVGGIEVVISERIDPEAIDAVPQLTRIKAASPDAIHLQGAGDVIGPIVRGMEQLAMTDIPVGCASGYMNLPAFELMAGHEPDLIIGPVQMVHRYPFGLLEPEDEAYQLTELMWDMWKFTWGEDRMSKDEFLMTWIPWDFEMMHLMVAGIEAAWPLPDDLQAARQAINDALENDIVNWEGLQGTRTMTPTDHVGLPPGAAVVIQIKDGEFTRLN